MTHVQSYYNNSGYTMFSRYLKIVIILDFAAFLNSEKKNSEKQKNNWECLAGQGDRMLKPLPHTHLQ